MKKTEHQIEALVEALDDTPLEGANHGVDIPALAGKLRGMVAAADRKDRFAAASLAYAEALARLEQTKHAAPAGRDAQLATMKKLIARVPQEQVAMHFLKYESASDEELAELVRALQHLLGDEGE